MHKDLERWVNQHGLSQVLKVLAFICSGKARHIRADENISNKRLATVWDFAASCCMTAARKPSVVHVSPSAKTDLEAGLRVAQQLRPSCWALLLIIVLAGSAQADVLQADASWAASPDSRGTLSLFYTPVDAVQRAVFIMESGGNRGVLARDATPQGWLDVGSQFWDLTVDGFTGEAFGLGGQYWHLDPFLEQDSVRLVRTADESYVTVNDVKQAVVWSNVVTEVPEPTVATTVLGWLLAAAIGIGTLRRQAC